MSQIDKQGLSEEQELLGACARGYTHDENSSKELDSDLIKAMVEELLPIISQAKEARDKEIIAYLRKIESESDGDADHCSCLRYAIYHLENPQNDGMVYASKEALSKKEL
jgi:hypothetical protein